jgi:hypothetical protein
MPQEQPSSIMAPVNNPGSHTMRTTPCSQCHAQNHMLTTP